MIWDALSVPGKLPIESQPVLPLSDHSIKTCDKKGAFPHGRQADAGQLLNKTWQVAGNFAKVTKSLFLERTMVLANLITLSRLPLLLLLLAGLFYVTSWQGQLVFLGLLI